jgi:hypothetical protein
MEMNELDMDKCSLLGVTLSFYTNLGFVRSLNDEG